MNPVGAIGVSQKEKRRSQIPNPPLFIYHPLQHLHECLIEAFDEAVNLGVVDRHP